MSEYKEFWLSFVNVGQGYINIHTKKPLYTKNSELRKVVHVIEKQDYTDLQEKAEKLVEALEFIKDNPNYGQYHDGSSECKAKEALKEWRKS